VGTGGPSSRYLPALDGLRALAVAAVLLFHADLGIARGGFLGVSVFFTLSGFLITRLLIDERERAGRISLSGFYGRRVRRLIPAAYLCIAAVLALGFVWGAAQRKNLPGDAVAAVANVANWRFAFASRSYMDLFVGLPSPLAHFWSLAIEEQCYLVLPLVAVWALRRSRVRLAVVLGVLTLASVVATLLTHDRNLVYNGTHTRAAELLLGALAAVAVSYRMPSERVRLLASAAGLTALTAFVGVCTLADAWLYRGGFVLVAVASTAAVVGLTGDHAVARVVGHRWLAAVGKVSYGVYLFHWPVFLVLTPERVGWSPWPLLALRVAATSAVTIASYRWLERPVRLRRVLVVPRVGLTVFAAAVACIVALAVVAVPAPHFTPTQELLALGTSDTVVFTAPTTAASMVPPTVAPVPTAPTLPKVLVLGSVDAAARRLVGQGWNVVDATDPNCPAVPGVAVRDIQGVVTDTSHCVEAVRNWPRRVKAEHPDVVVLTVGPIDAAIVRRASDAGFPANDDVTGLAARMRLGQDGLKAAVVATDALRVPMVLFDAAPTVADYHAGLDEVAMELAPPLVVHHRLADLDAAVRSLVTASTAPAAEATRVLVLGDSTSLDVAKALNDGSDGKLTVMWAGANGCPFVRAEATRPEHTDRWHPVKCDPFDRKLPPLLASFHPDGVLLVVGPTELQEQRYPGDPTGHVAGDRAFTAFHDHEMTDFLKVLGKVPLVITDSPRVRKGGWATSEMAARSRADAWNRQVQRWVSSSTAIQLLPYAAPLVAYEARHGGIRSDGVHPDVGPLTDLARATLIPELLGLLHAADGVGSK
jgi:peptidoglycan/LPS O-acetylase OafA/YrhL